MSIVSGTVGAILGSNAQNDATRANRKNTKDTNALNYKMFRESRGDGGNAVLPLYMLTKEGKPFEGNLSTDLIDAYDQSIQPRSDYDAVANRYASTQAAARKTAAGIFDGGVRKEMEDNFAPVKAGRVNYTRESALTALNKTLADIDAVQASKGFSSDSLGTRMLKFKANKQMGDSIAGVNLQNLEDERAIGNADLNLRLQNLDLPARAAASEMSLFRMPDDAYIDSIMKGLQPLSFLRIGGSQPFQYQPMPMQSANPSAAQLAMQGVSAAGNTALNYYMQNRQQQNYLNAIKSLSNTGAGGGAAASGAAAGSAGGGAALMDAEVPAWSGAMA
jgi:hypothetical protein